MGRREKENKLGKMVFLSNELAKEEETTMFPTQRREVAEGGGK